MTPKNEAATASRFRFRAWDGKGMVFFGLCETPWPWSRENPVMQSTGLTDKNGKEQFASDIVRAKSNQTKKIVVGVIEWRDKEAAFRLVVPGDYCYRLDDVHNVEVIGNIHEHSHLIPTPL